MPAKDQGSRIGSLVVNPGGPGASATSYAAAADAIVGTQVRRYFDVVGFDPRGVGQSEPLDCLSDSQLDDFMGTDQTPDDAAEEQALLARPARSPRVRGQEPHAPAAPVHRRLGQGHGRAAAPHSATGSSTISASPTAPSSARRMPASSPSASAVSSSTGSCHPTSPTRSCPRARRAASSSRPAPTSPTASRRVTARSGPRSRKGWRGSATSSPRSTATPSRRATPAPLAWVRRGRRGDSGRRCTTRAPGAH